MSDDWKEWFSGWIVDPLVDLVVPCTRMKVLPDGDWTNETIRVPANQVRQIVADWCIAVNDPQPMRDNAAAIDRADAILAGICE